MRTIFLVVVTCLIATFQAPQSSAQERVAPKLEPFVGWWIGDGRLGFKGGKTENIKCRAVYRRAKDFDGLDQSIRCATNSGTVHIVSKIQLNGDDLVGNWEERKYNLTGNLRGKAVPGGFRVEVSGTDLRANMTVLARGKRQLVEVQFSKSTLLGLNVILTRGTPRS